MSLTLIESHALLAQLKLRVWQASANALLLSFDQTSISEADALYLSEQVGHLLTFLARRGIVPCEPSPAVVEPSAIPSERSLPS